ncbi:tRNA (adenosine(37)-N6)-threonylcarbamoyltransferase complex dimerization subunit type 1 TsaB [Avibacterium paragallinarum]|uniref:tRNA threonylcarbamoyladenosine biosynthesis protein TsaB n=1 Tax=Avibacterium paragallinarum TaxID=728 RepID=A0A377I8G0_AVIPA|nr:tRNA (adenosine(37)-N6)-threonylcarbamoyltransferase complex dimerization subunit type 1 TsaB [Avibacterium paragallinarum]POY47221.1 tRNA (adenosine(37)-N6)-threonylcarbamoyltransferase complex dimerization subunit type 1 TsaB [Avibacterium paragallinarum]RZN75565.1 tRNA (adenosine(37)-N6)-threonylcarbamoyltransferase complex dimerization subunit type 1 TsaB [Avibacterium paragallinarum]STO71566.1 glycoprotease [Avibacterium paragallinarum]
MTTLLALDTSTEACSVALLHKGEITHLDELAQRTHTKRILPMVDEILSQSGLQLKQVDALVFGRGPGSFTGVRVGAGIAQGLALGADLPAIPISNLTAMAQQAYEQYGTTEVLCAIDARMNEVYFSQLHGEKVRSDFGTFFSWQPVVAEQVCSPERVLEQAKMVENGMKVGTGWQAYVQLEGLTWAKSSEILLPSARAMLPLALPQYWQKQWISAVEIEPVYLRNEVTWKKLPGRE